MTKLYAVAMSISAMLLCLLVGARPAKAADYNYVELYGNVVAMQETTDINVNTQVSHLREVSLSVRTTYGGLDETVTVNCPTNGTALTTLCRDANTMLNGYCPVVVATSTCFPDASGNCSFVTFRACSSGVGKCVWAWGPLKTSNGIQRPFLDNLFTRTQSSCNAK